MQCAKDESIKIGTFKVSGYLYSAGIPVANAKISLDSVNTYQSTTNGDGYFEITNVAMGNYKLKVTNNQTDSSFSELNSKIKVSNDTLISDLKLPTPIKLLSITDIKSTSLKISWNKTNATDFREYKLYRHSTSGLDETSGTLAHVSTSINDTSFVDFNLTPNSNYYYRVYVMNDYGRLGGSNIVNNATTVYNYITNGNFEDQTNSFWLDNSYNKLVEYTTLNKYSGERSLHIVRDTSSYSYNGCVFKTIGSVIPFQRGKLYKISCWIRQHGKKYNGMMAYVAETGVGITFNPKCGAGLDIFSKTDEWIYNEDFFTCLDDYNLFTIQLGTLHEEVWFDELKIEVMN